MQKRNTLFLTLLSISAHSASIVDPQIKITELKSEHIEKAKHIFYQNVHELQFISSSSIEDVITFCTEKNACKDYDDPDTYYFNNRGTLLVVLYNDIVVGTGGIKRIDDESCEVKRVFFAQEIRGLGVSKLLGERLLDTARTLGYKKIFLEMYKPEAQATALLIAKKWGFAALIKPYYEGSTCKIWMEKKL